MITMMKRRFDILTRGAALFVASVLSEVSTGEFQRALFEYLDAEMPGFRKLLVADLKWQLRWARDASRAKRALAKKLRVTITKLDG